MKKKTASENLLSQLGKTLESEKTASRPLPSTSKNLEPRKTQKSEQPKSRPPKKAKAINRNVSLYPENDDIIYEIQLLLRKHTGKKCSDSRAIQLALKLFPMKEVNACISVFEELCAQDGRSSKSD